MASLMWEDYILNLFDSGLNLTVLILGVLISIIFFYLFKKSEKVKTKVLFLYGGLAFLLTPFIFGAFNWQWHSMSSVFNCNPKQLMVLIPSSIFGAFSFGFFIIPLFYRKMNSSIELRSKAVLDFVNKESQRLGIKTPKVYLIKKSKPLAHSFTNIRPTIFISVGMFELFTKKEIEAVLLHELYHVKQRFSFSKFSAFFLKIFIPVPSFMSLVKHLDKEEKDADKHACEIQRTDRYLLSAKIKIKNYTH